MVSVLFTTTSSLDLVSEDFISKETLKCINKKEYCIAKLVSLMLTTGNDTFSLHKKAGGF